MVEIQAFRSVEIGLIDLGDLSAQVGLFHKSESKAEVVLIGAFPIEITTDLSEINNVPKHKLELGQAFLGLEVGEEEWDD